MLGQGFAEPAVAEPPAQQPTSVGAKVPAVVYLYRPSKLLGMAIRYHFFINGDYITSLPNASFVRLEIPGGATTIGATIASRS
jgi:hypothetical protein